MRTKFPVAVHIFFLAHGRVLLLRRYNTGWQDGNYSVVAGHVEAGESVTQAALREVREEAGLMLTADQLRFVGVMHRNSDSERIDFFFVAQEWEGEPANAEPERCDDMGWYPLDALPANTVPYIRRGLANYRRGAVYDEFGWTEAINPASAGP
jgi:8-oxo-dGTP diphosphatase